MKNIHVLPTEKPGRFKQNNITKKISLVKNKGIDLTAYTPINIYITSDEEIKEGDWVLYNKKDIRKYDITFNKKGMDWNVLNTYKIILTDNKNLNKDGVQAIDDEFLEWFIKNPSCESVEVEIDYFKWRKGTQKLDDVFKIIIPKEEAKQEIPQIGTKEFNDLASAYFGGKPKQ